MIFEGSLPPPDGVVPDEGADVLRHENVDVARHPVVGVTVIHHGS